MNYEFPSDLMQQILPYRIASTISGDENTGFKSSGYKNIG
jgi:hypothetical protein